MAVSAELRRRISEDYPAFAWLLDIPEVGNLLGTAANEGWGLTKLQAKLYATSWWKRSSESSRQWNTLAATDPATANEQIGLTERAMRREADRLGVRLTGNEYRFLTIMSKLRGWNADDITANILKAGAGRDYKAGRVRVLAGELQALGKQYGVPVSAKWTFTQASKIAAGRQTLEGLANHFRERALWKAAAEGNEQIVRGLEKGMTLWEVMEPTIGRVAEELEVDIDTFDLTEGWGHQLLNYKDKDTGKIRMMNDSEAIQWARSQRQWRDTDRARSMTAELADGITRKMGARA